MTKKEKKLQVKKENLERHAIKVENKRLQAEGVVAKNARLKAIGIDSKVALWLAIDAAKARLAAADCLTYFKQVKGIHTLSLLTDGGRRYKVESEYFHCAVNEAFDMKEQHERCIAEQKVWRNY